MSTCRVIAITKFYVVVDVAFKFNSENSKIGKYGSNFRSFKLLDFRQKWPEIATSLENWHLNQRYVFLHAWRYDFFTWLSFLACFSSTLALPAWHYYSMHNIDSNILFSTLFYHWATSFLRFNFLCFFTNFFCSNNPKKKRSEGKWRTK